MVPKRGFDPAAMFAAIERNKGERGLSWTAVAREMWAQAEGLHASVDGHKHPIAVRTITQLSSGTDTTCQHALVMLRWLRRPPEDFIAEPVPGTAGTPLPEPGPDFMIRWDLKATYEALNGARLEREATWEQTAARLRCTPNQLTGLRTAKYGTRMRLAMRISQALRRPARDFVVATRR
ncbi:MAG: hypothetical protein JWN96_3977 [Mycobacterium sp.]|nr:hypothetical protein [Mycobacterium sp.]